MVSPAMALLISKIHKITIRPINKQIVKYKNRRTTGKLRKLPSFISPSMSLLLPLELDWLAFRKTSFKDFLFTFFCDSLFCHFISLIILYGISEFSATILFTTAKTIKWDSSLKRKAWMIRFRAEPGYLVQQDLIRCSFFSCEFFSPFQHYLW